MTGQMTGRKGPPRAAVFGCEGPALSDAEKRFFEDANPLGFILFARNIETPDQVRALVRDLRATVGDAAAPVLIDQEGGRVQRLRPPHWPDRPPASQFAAAYRENPDRASADLAANARAIARDLAGLGITVDCWPVLDLPQPGADPIIGDRALGADTAAIAALGGVIIDALHAGGVTPVIKHIPGHGRATVDSHKALPVVATDLATLRDTDFAPFRALNAAPWAMTAHVVYTAVDPGTCATFSPKVVDRVIRGDIGFDGLLISDDLSMHALTGAFAERTRRALAAGCDVVLHCNGVMAEMAPVAEAAHIMTDKALARAARAETQRRATETTA
ncbi:beta-N-acetylhexosaminidase [Thalassospiraceae bacterium LMO-SO8]|nr:beta-N-acetylhexosaminidase [Alphaproteobacteria bacterium LMO-S08]WND75400.1 beta-N-acetylhexosaminidase [Thalassospiraceae bacterium LMO-SO8]